MSLFDRLFIEGARAGSRRSTTTVRTSGHYTIEADDFGFARTEVDVGDMDGSGEQPGVQLTVEHQFTGGPIAVAYSAREAELLARALWMAALEIKPHERLRQRRVKWSREQPKVTQPHPPIDGVDRVDLSQAEVEAILMTTDPALEALRARLEIPY